jgi:predicted acetyltransferase
MVDIRSITAEDAHLFRSRVYQAFGRDVGSDEAAAERFDAIFDFDRTLAAFDGDDIVGTCAAFPLGLTVPGGVEVAMGGTTVVTVRPTHRRQGVLRALIGHHFDDIAERGEPLAGLWASEGSIYGRFGYGPASNLYDARIHAQGVRFEGEAHRGVPRLVDAEEAGTLFRRIYEQARLRRAGMLTRNDAWWEHRVLADSESWREGKSEHRYIVYEEEGEPTGYAMYRQKGKWDDQLPDGVVSVTEVVAATPDAHRGLWSYLLNVDLFPNVEYWNLPFDDPLPHLLDNHRRVTRRLEDALWLRLMDVPKALAKRGYEHDGVVVFGITDTSSHSTAGTYRLEVVDGVGQCERVDVAPELELDISVLSRLYLGGGGAPALAAAGWITGSPEAVSALHRIMRTDVAPWCPEVF